MIQFKEYIQ